MKYAAWNKNNRRELRKTLGRFLAIVSIVALGVGFFTGLKSSRPAMVQTGRHFLDRMNFYDLQLVSTIGFDEDAADTYASLDGVAAAEGSISADMMVMDSGESKVFKTHSLLSSINQVQLTAGWFPQAANECLGDDLYFTEEDLGKILTVENREDSLFSQDSYVLVGIGNSPQYLNLSRGSTSLGTGSVAGFLFLTREGYDADYCTELYLRLEGDRELFSSEYDDALETWEEPLLAILEEQGAQRLDRVVAEARQELDDGWQAYYDGKAEFDEAKADAEQQLADGWQELEDAAQKLEDARRELEDGEAELARLQADPYSNPQLAQAKAQLDAGRKELEEGQAQYEQGREQYEAMKKPLQLLISKAERGLSAAQAALNAAQAEYDNARKAFEEAEAELLRQQEQLYEPVRQQEQALQEAQAELRAREEALAQLQQSGADPAAIAQAALAVESARAEVSARQTAYDAAKAAYDAQNQLLQSSLDQTRDRLNRAQAALDQAQAQVDSFQTQLNDARQQLQDAEMELLEADIQLQEGRAKLEEGEATLQREIQNAIASARTQLDDGWAELADGQTQYEEGLQTYYEKENEARKELADAEKELADAERELRQGEVDLARMKNPSYYVLTPASNNGYISFRNDTKIVEGVAKVFPLFFFLVAALVCSSTMSRMVEEQRTQNGTLKALGYSDLQIMMRYSNYAGSAAIIGSAIGLLVGTFLFPYVIWEAYQMLYHFSALEFLFNWPVAAISVAAALLCCVGAACAAAWSDLRQMPAQLMRPKAPKAGKRIFLEYIKPLWNSLGFLAKVSLRNIFRYRKRLFMMILGTGGCLSLLLAGLGLRDSVAHVADDQFEQITLYDFVVTFDSNRSAAQQEKFREEHAQELDRCVFAGVSSLTVPTSLGNQSISVVACSDPEMDELLGLSWDGVDLGYPTGDGLYVSSALAEDAGLKVGDLLPLQLDRSEILEIPITGIFTNYVRHYAYLTQEGYETWFGIEPELNTAFCTTASDDVYTVGASLQSSDDVVNVTASQELRDMVSNAMSSLNSIVLLVVSCAIALSFVVGYNLININITERAREIATIKVLGFYRSETHSYVFRESILLTILGALAGIPLGIWLHRFIMNCVKTDFVCFQTRIAPLSYVLGVVITVLVTLAVNGILSSKIDKINMAESLKSVE